MKETITKRWDLFGHLIVWGLILAMALGAVAWEVSINLPPNLNAYSNKPATLTWQLAAGQDALAAKIKSFCVAIKRPSPDKLPGKLPDNQSNADAIKGCIEKEFADVL